MQPARPYYLFTLLFLAACASPQPKIEITELQMKNAKFIVSSNAVNFPDCRGTERLVTPDLSSQRQQYIQSSSGHKSPVISMQFKLKCGNFEKTSPLLLGARGYIGRERKDGKIEHLWIDPQ